jgi:Flp pilus assembly protein TadG
MSDPMRNLIKLICRASSRCRGLGADCTGTAAVMLALSLASILGLSGLGTEVAAWYMATQTMQAAADAAAYTAVIAKSKGASVGQLTTEAQSIAGRYKFVDGSAGVSVTVNSPPASGSHKGNSTAVEVIVAQPQTPLISGLLMSSGPTLQARSVATTVTTGSGCVVALDRGDVVDVTDSGSTILNLNGCSLYINSDDSAALTMSGSAVIDAGAAYISGGIRTSGGAQLDTTKGTYTGVAPINDPYADVNVPYYSGCYQTNYSDNSSTPQTLNATGTTPYVFCNGLTLTGQSSLTLGPGTYIIDRGSFSLSGQSTLTATGGATIILTSSTGSNYATATVSGGATVSITAPCTGPTAGLAFFQDRNAPSSGTDSFTGGTTQNINGAIYFPDQTVTYSGGSATGGAICTQLVALKLKFSGNSTFNNNCASVCTATIGSTSSQIIE